MAILYFLTPRKQHSGKNSS